MARIRSGEGEPGGGGGKKQREPQQGEKEALRGIQ